MLFAILFHSYFVLPLPEVLKQTWTGKKGKATRLNIVFLELRAQKLKSIA